MASSLRARAAVVATGILLAAPAAAEDPPPPPPQGESRKPPPPPPPAPGAKRARPKTPPPPPKRFRGKRNEREAPPPDGVPVASFPGFSRLEDGSTRVWMEVSSKVDIGENKAQGRVTFRAKGTFVMQRTNQLPLLTGFFNTPVERVQLVQQGPDVDLIIETRESTQFVHRVVETPRGIVLQVDFPPLVTSDKERDQPEKPRAKRTGETRTIRNNQDKNDPPPPSVDE